MCFAGHYTTETDDVCVEYDFTNKDWREEITKTLSDPDLMELLESEYESWLDWYEENNNA
jgi:hypothetical protein